MEKYEDIIRNVQLVQTKTLKKFDEICRKYDIKYWICYGSLIGAIRHNGFIPWDDDLDIGIMRSDYNKLSQVPREEWGDNLLFCLPSSADERHDKTFARIYVKNSRIQSLKDINHWRKWSDGKPWSTSLMCDLFIFDKVSENREEFLKIHRIFDKRKRLYKITKLKPYTSSTKFTDLAMMFLIRSYSRLMRFIWREPWAVIDKKNEKLALKHQGSLLGSYYAADCNDSRGKQTFPEDVIFPLKEASFEGIRVYIPNKYDELLRCMYGDYMVLPPESQRHHITPVFLDLGDGKEHIFSNVPGSLGDHE